MTDKRSDGLELHRYFMTRCLKLASKGKGYVSPNPMVGSLVVLDGRIIGEGYHPEHGAPHAEVMAIRSVRDPFQLPKSTLYVSLEPCCHHGKTPPCTDLILASGIREVVCACEDPFPAVHGAGIKILRENGVNVLCNVLDLPAKFINRRFFINNLLRRPYIILKWAETSDGFIAPKERIEYWISSPPARALVHEWRAEEMAVLVGYNTALIDNPALSLRLTVGRQPKRITIDRDLTLPRTHKIFDGSVPTIIITTKPDLPSDSIQYLQVSSGATLLPEALSKLHELRVQSILVEGGTATINSLIKLGAWDEMRVFTSKKEFKAGLAAPKPLGKPVEERLVGEDILRTYYNPLTFDALKIPFESESSTILEAI